MSGNYNRCEFLIINMWIFWSIDFIEILNFLNSFEIPEMTPGLSNAVNRR